MIIGDFALLNDIGKEHLAGLDTSGEWPILYVSQVLHLLFTVLIPVVVILTRRKPAYDDSIDYNNDYNIYCTIFCRSF